MKDFETLANKLDKEDMKSILENYKVQIDEGLLKSKNVKLDFDVSDINKIVVCGMGGSALVGDFLQSYLDLKIPIVVVKDYVLPSFVDKSSLVFCISYSGNTEETLEIHRQLEKKKIKSITISSGGQLEKVSKSHILISKGLPPRLSLVLQFFLVYEILKKYKFVKDRKDVLEDLKLFFEKDVKKVEKKAKEIAVKIYDKIPLIYSSTQNRFIAEKCKIDFNENSKEHAFFNVFSEFNHNEILGFCKIKDSSKFVCLFFEDDEDNDRTKVRMKVVKSLIRKEGFEIISLKLVGKSRLRRMFYGVYLGDWISYYLALLNKVDPTEVKIIESLKKMIKE